MSACDAVRFRVFRFIVEFVLVYVWSGFIFVFCVSVPASGSVRFDSVLV